MRRAWLGALVVATSGCPPVAVCTSNAECAPDGMCVSGLCVSSTDGGLDGGAPIDAGRLDAGADGGSDAGTGIDGGMDAGSCGLCSDGSSCDEPSRTCVLRVSGLSFVRPDANDVYGGNRPLRLELRAEADASVSWPSSLQVTSMPTGFSQVVPLTGAATWSLETLTPTTSGTFTLSARLSFGDAGFDAQTRLVVDATRPVVTLVAEPAPARSNDGGFSDRDPTSGFAAAYKKDELVELRVQANVAVAVGVADFGLPAAALSLKANCTSCSGVCQCFELDLAKVPLDALRGTLDAGVGALADALGNRSAPANLALPVTRWKWRRTLIDQTLSMTNQPVDVMFPPALDEDGRVHLAVGYNQTTQGALWQVSQSGETRVDYAFMEEPNAPPIVFNRLAYAQGVTQLIRRFDTAQTATPPTFSPLMTPSFLCADAQWTGTWALSDERLYLLGAAGRLTAGSAMLGQTCDGSNLAANFNAPNGLAVALPLAGTSARIFMGRPSPGSSSTIVRIDHFPAAATRFQNPISAPAPQGVSSLVAFDEVVAASSNVATPSTIAVSAWGPDLSNRVEARTDAGTTYGPLIAAGTRAQPVFVLGDATGTLRRIAYTAPPTGMPDAGSFAGEFAPITGVDALLGPNNVWAAPVLGANGLLYVVSPATGRLSVVDLSSGQLLWTHANAFTPGAVSPALDVARGPLFAKQCGRGIGILYVGALNDSAMTAVVVDSEGLDRTAPWPRDHHDNGNTRNPETPLTAWSCP